MLSEIWGTMRGHVICRTVTEILLTISKEMLRVLSKVESLNTLMLV